MRRRIQCSPNNQIRLSVNIFARKRNLKMISAGQPTLMMFVNHGEAPLHDFPFEERDVVPLRCLSGSRYGRRLSVLSIINGSDSLSSGFEEKYFEYSSHKKRKDVIGGALSIFTTRT